MPQTKKPMEKVVAFTPRKLNMEPKNHQLCEGKSSPKATLLLIFHGISFLFGDVTSSRSSGESRMKVNG